MIGLGLGVGGAFIVVGVDVNDDVGEGGKGGRKEEGDVVCVVLMFRSVGVREAVMVVVVVGGGFGRGIVYE